MKKILIITCLVAVVSFAELAVPSGAAIEKPVTTVQAVPVSKIEVSELRCILPAGTNQVAPSYVISMVLTDENGAQTRQVMRMSAVQAEQIMAGTGHNLSNIVSSATAAIQAVINQRFGGTP